MNLRRRLLLSHVLPLMISIPLIGLVLITALEARLIIPSLTSQIEENARLATRVLMTSPNTWQDSDSAQTFIDRYIGEAPWRMMLIDAEGRILASNDPRDRTRYGQLTHEPEPTLRVLAGESVLETDFSASLDTRVIDYWIPVYQGDEVQGAVRISQPLIDVLQTFTSLRMTIFAILFGGMALGVLIGLGLAATIQQPLRQLTQAMSAISSGDNPTTVQTSGPEELKILAHSFNTLVYRLEKEAGSRKQLLANLVHELGRPLGALRSAIQALSHGADQDSELKADLLDGMDMQINSLTCLIEDLTQLYDRERGALHIELVPTNLNNWFQTSTQPWHTLAAEKGIAWSAKTTQLPTHPIDPVRLGQAWGNLLSNAIKFTPSGGEIEVAAEVAEGDIRFRVTDTGSGLPPEDKERVFIPFFRSNHDLRFPQGMGLGLSIAEELVRAHHGYIQFESELGKGSMFTICLPLVPQPNPTDHGQELS